MINKVTFEQFRLHIQDIRPSEMTDAREINWVISRILGFAKSRSGALEIFLPGIRIFSSSSIVQRHLDYRGWLVDQKNEKINSNRLVFPADEHFIGIVALISTELVRAGLGVSSLEDVFRRIEPVIEIALRGNSLDDEFIIGLIGELILLEGLLDIVSKQPKLQFLVLEMWRGHLSGTRDFVVGDQGIEVKTTRHDSSSHSITGLHQISLGGSTEHDEKGLWLFSVGLARCTSGGQTLPEITQRILVKFSEKKSEVVFSPLQNMFLKNVAAYGGNPHKGYNHVSMSKDPAYLVRYRTTFSPRLYNLLDEDVRLIRSVDLANTFVAEKTMKYQIDFPDAINFENPSASWHHSLLNIMKPYLNI